MKTLIRKMAVPFVGGILLLVGTSDAQDIFSLSRPYSPVIFKGENLPDFLGKQSDKIKAYRYQSTTQAWEAVPFQIDERDAASLSFFGTKNGVLDAVDEIVFMAQDAGDRAPVSEWIDDTESRNNTRLEIRVTDPLNSGNSGWIYLYQSATLPLSPVKYIQYQSSTDVVETPTFRIAHGANGFQDEIFLKTKAGGDSIDFLDRQKFRLKLFISELGLNKEVTLKEEMDEDVQLFTGVSAHVKVQREGVRFNDNPVIRMHRELKLQGSFYAKIPLLGEFKIDTTFAFPMIYYPNYMELKTGEIEFKKQDEFHVREFRISADLSQDARGMTFYNPYNTAGFLIDGTKDTPNTTLAWPGVNWYMAVSNPEDALSKMKHGTLLTVADLAGDPIGNQQLYYLDWFWPDGNDTGDKSSYGDAGFRVTGSDLAGKLDASMASFYLPMNLNITDAGTIANQYATPLSVQSVAQSVHRLLVTVDPPEAGIVARIPEGDLISAGSQVSLTAMAHQGFEFSYWTGDLSGNENPATLSMNADKSIIAHFIPRIYVIVKTDPSGTSFMVDGTRYYNFKQFSWNPGDTHVIETDSVRGINMGVRAAFNDWDNGSERRFEYQVPSANDTITGYFTIQYQLTTRISPAGGGQIQVTPPGDGWYNKGEIVSLLATPAPGYDFIGWTGALNSTANPASLTINNVSQVTATFGNAPPVIALADTVFVEDDTLMLTRQSIWPWVTDATHPDSVLKITLTEGKYLDVKMDSVSGKYELFAKTGNWNGIDTVGIEARDPLGQTGSGKLVVTVSAMPDPPGPFALSTPEDGGIYPDWPQSIPFSWESSVDPDIGDKVTYIFELDSTESFGSNELIRYVNLSSEEFVMPWPVTYGDHEYYWRVWAVDEDSLITRCIEPYRTLSLATAIAEESAQLPNTFMLDQNYPNPFNGETLIRFGLPRDSHVTLSVFNNSGQRVAILINGEKPAGYYTVHWRGKDDRGLAVASGIYFIRLDTPSFTAVKKSIYLR